MSIQRANMKLLVLIFILFVNDRVDSTLIRWVDRIINALAEDKAWHDPTRSAVSNEYHSSFYGELFSHQWEKLFNDQCIAIEPEMIMDYDYPVEIHHVVTEDGYILEMHRIPGNSSNPSPDGKIPCILFHGILASSSDWILPGPRHALGYLLADAGYDVWLANARGNTYSRNHTDHALLDSGDFWEFTWHQMGIYDVPASIDKILEVTGQERLYYFGHSQGTTIFWVMASERPEYNDKIITMFALAPIAYLSHARTLLAKFLTPIQDLVKYFSDLLGYKELLPSTKTFRHTVQHFCKDGMPTQHICTTVIFIIFGYDPVRLNNTMLPMILSLTPAGSSVNQVLHFLQLIRSRRFCQFDHGKTGNQMTYGQDSPPSYDLGKVTAKVIMYYSHNDLLSDPRDVNVLFKELGNKSNEKYNAGIAWSHIDYIWTIAAGKAVNEPMISMMMG